jgi:TonB family protein
MTKHLIIIATLLLLTASAYCQTPPINNLIAGEDSLHEDVTAPWPASDSLLMPDFRECAKCQQICSAKVTVQTFVAKDGTVKKCVVARSQPKGLGFEELVERTIQQWHFVPAQKDSQLVGVWLLVRFHFACSDRGLDSTQFIKCQRYAKVGKQPDPYAIYQPPVIVLCP